MKSPSHLIQTASARRGPELRMLHAAMRDGLPLRFSNNLVLREARLPSGIPDLIAVEPCRRIALQLPKRRPLNAQHLHVLHLLNNFGATGIETICRLLNHSIRRIKSLIRELEVAELIDRREDQIVPRSTSAVFVAKHIIAIEAKISAWREALRQAVGNLWFASHSYILIPAKASIKAICQEAKAMGIGVLVYDGSKTRTMLRARRQDIPVSYGSWLINEWACSKLK